MSCNFFGTITFQRSQILPVDPAKIEGQSRTGTLVGTCLLK